jgi:hypothetical protein
LGVDVYWLPVPRQELVEAVGGMTVGHALQNVSEPGKGLDVVELCGGDEGNRRLPIEFPDTCKNFPVLRNIFPVNLRRELREKRRRRGGFLLRKSV